MSITLTLTSVLKGICCVVLLTSAGKTLHLDIFVVLILFGVYNIICQMQDYQQVFHVNYKKKYDPPP